MWLCLHVLHIQVSSNGCSTNSTGSKTSEMLHKQNNAKYLHIYFKPPQEKVEQTWPQNI